MIAILYALGIFACDLLKSRHRLQAENLFLRHQLNIALRRGPPRPRLRGSDRALLVWMTRICPGLLNLAQVVKPETILRWHRASFKAYWRWKSRNRSRAVSPDQQSHGCDQSDSRLSIGARHPGPAGASLPTTNGKLSSAARV